MFSYENHRCLRNFYLSRIIQVQIYFYITSPLSPVGLEKNQQMVPNVFGVDQAAQAYDIYLIIYACVGVTEANARGHT